MAVRVSPFWAVIHHDGRGAVTPNLPRRLLVWFRDPGRDPRLRPRRPFRLSQLDRRRLIYTAATFRRLVKSGELVVTRRSPRSDTEVKSFPFFGNVAQAPTVRFARAYAINLFRGMTSRSILTKTTQVPMFIRMPRV